jgi:uncharacterized membrane protein
MSKVKASLALLVALMVTWAVDLARFLPRMPEPMAVHFGGSGKANGWMTHRQMLVFDVWMLVVVLVAVLGVGLTTRLMPTRFINIPHRDYWFAPERRSESVARLAGHMVWLGCLIVALLIAVDHLIFVVNLRPGPPQLGTREIVLPMAGFLLGLLIWVVRLHRLFPRPPIRSGAG